LLLAWSLSVHIQTWKNILQIAVEVSPKNNNNALEIFFTI
jgi:hypothetical protein